MNPDAAGKFYNNPYDPGATVEWPHPQSGQQYADIGDQTTPLSQTFTIASSGEYRFSWYDSTAVVNGYSSIPYTVNLINGSSENFFSTTQNASHPGSWQDNTLTQALMPGSYTLQFIASSNPIDTVIDNVSVSAVPLPAAGILFVSALGGVFSFRKNSRKSV